MLSLVHPHEPLNCDYFEAGRCRSCVLIKTPYAEQLLAKEQQCRDLLQQVAADAWLPPFSSGDRGFRNRVKLVIGGVAGDVTLGILDAAGEGVDLRECAIQTPEIARELPALAGVINETGLPPYNVAERRGELKFAHVTCSPDNEVMLRFVTRTQHGLDVLRSRLAALRKAVPNACVVTVNLLPEHKAVLEGEREEVLLGESLAMRLGTAEKPLTLHLLPQSFFQTNTAVAQELYAQVAAWAVAARPATLWDLYCGVGGFAVHCAAALDSAGAQHTDVLGVEVSQAAVNAATLSAREAGIAARFVAADAIEFALAATRDGAADPPEKLPEMLVVNPPRRGIGEKLAGFIETSGIQTVVYSSCNPVTLASDLAQMPSYSVAAARVFDMFPHTSHLEVAVLLERTSL